MTRTAFYYSQTAIEIAYIPTRPQLYTHHSANVWCSQRLEFSALGCS